MGVFTAILLAAALLLIEGLAGGTRLIFSLPTLALLGLLALLAPLLRRRIEVAPRPTCLAATALFIGYALARAAGSSGVFLGWADGFTMLGCIAVYLLTVFCIPDSRDRRVVLTALSLLALGEIFLGLRQYATGETWLPFGMSRPLLDTKRAAGTLINANHYAGMLEMLGALAVSFAAWGSWSGWKRAFAGYTGLLCYVGIVISGSRGGWASAVFSLAIFSLLSLYVQRQTRPRKFPLGVAFSIFLGIAALGGGVKLMLKNPALENRIGSLGAQFEGKYDIRIYNWQAALDQFHLAPLIGTGPGTHLYYGRQFRRVEVQSDPIHAHSDYLELLAEYGILGAAAAALFIMAHLIGGWRACRWLVQKELHDTHEAVRVCHDGLALQIGALSGLAALLVHSAVDFNLHIPGNALLAAFLCGLLASPDAPPLADATRRRIAWLRWLTPIAGSVLIFVTVTHWRGAFFGEKARISLREDQLGDAINFSEIAIAAEKQNPELYFVRGLALRVTALRSTFSADRERLLTSALADFRETLRLFPQDENAMIRMAQTLAELRRFQEADAAFQSAIQLDPRLYRLRIEYANYLRRIGREARADDVVNSFPALPAAN